MRNYFLIFRLLFKAKFIFKNPNKHNLIIFDDESLFELSNFINNYNFFVIQPRLKNINKIYFSPKIFKLIIKNYNGNLMTAYLTSIIELVQPKVVLTFIDNSLKFSNLARIFDKKINFVAIQNAARYDFKIYKYRYKKKLANEDHTKNMYITNFLCFGQFEIDHYKKYKIKVKNFFKVGSLRLANFLHYIKKNKIKIKKDKYDICLISEAKHGRNAMYEINNLEKRFSETARYTIKFCKKYNMRLVFPFKRDKNTDVQGHENELNYYSKYLSKNDYNFLIKNANYKDGKNFSSYMASYQSKVTVGIGSTLLRENLAVGNKILSCNMSYTNIWDFPIGGICSLKNCTYDDFEKRLLKIYSMPKKKYFSRLGKDRFYMANFNNKISTIEILKKKIDYFLKKKN